jgi:hypothetical protein
VVGTFDPAHVVDHRLLRHGGLSSGIAQIIAAVPFNRQRRRR